jgi:hypothetical protein
MTEITSVTVPALATWPNVEIAQTGQWDISTGRVTLTETDFSNAVAALDCPAVGKPVLKLGHDEPMPSASKKRWDGEPAIGWIDNMEAAESGGTIVGDFVGMPGWLGTLLPSAYPNRSMEAAFDFQCQLGHLHPFVITAVALLGVTSPGIGTLESLQDVAALYGVMASESEDGKGLYVNIQATAKGEIPMPNPKPVELHAGISTEDVRRAFYDGAGYTVWIKEFQLDPPELITIDDATNDYARVPVSIENGEVTFGDAIPVEVQYVDKPQEKANASAGSRYVYASKNESRPAEQPKRKTADVPAKDAIHQVHQASVKNDGKEGSPEMDIAKVRNALGLPESATEDDVMAALAASRQPAPAPATDPAPTPVVPPVAAGSGVMVVDRSVIDELNARAARGEQAWNMMQNTRRDNTINAAIKAGKFAPGRADHFRELWDADPDGTETLINGMSPGLVPLNASGYRGQETDEQNSLYGSLYPDDAKV